MSLRRLRSQDWFNDQSKPDMTAIYLGWYLNYGLTREELQAGRPIIGIAQTGSDLAPCNRHHLELAKRVREGIRQAGGIAIEFPVHPIQETGRRPTASIDRNLAYLGLVELLHGYPLDGVVLLIGCDKTTPACLMAAATVNLPAIALSVGPMLNGWRGDERIGAGTTVWSAREQMARGELDYLGMLDLVAATVPSVGYCNTMGTAATMNSLAEVLGMQLTGAASIPAAYRERGQIAYRTGLRIVELVHDDVKPSDILSRDSFLNAIVVNSALGGSTNAPIHLAAVAAHAGIELTTKDWQEYGHGVPLLVDMQPAGRFLAEDFHRAGGVPAVVAALDREGLIRGDAATVTGRSLAENVRGVEVLLPEVIRPFAAPLMQQAGFIVLTGNLFESAIMKTSVIGEDFRRRYLEDACDPGAFEGRAVVFDGPEDYHSRIDNPDLGIEATDILIMRGAGPIGFPGAAEVVNMRPPSYLLREGISTLPCIGDGRQSGTSAAPSILNASPEAAAGGNLGVLRTGDRVRVDLGCGRVDVLLPDDELQERRRALERAGGFAIPASQTPWQQLQRERVGDLDRGMLLAGATDFQRVAQTRGLPRDNH